MLRVFISSTFRDLTEERAKLLSKLNTALAGVGMEEFTPDGRTSQEIAIEEIKKCDIVIFIISPYYGTLIEECEIKDCQCLKLGSCDGKISYTQCEYRLALSEGKPHQAYLVDKDWDVIEKLKDWEKIDWREVKSNSIFKEIDTDKIDHYFKIAKNVWKFKEEAERELCPRIKDIEDIQTITDHLAKKIIDWYSEGKINITDFCGRRKELKDLCEKIDEGVEVYGVGGIGKTTLIHIALLIQRLRGKKIVTICTMQSYLTGSGYRLFKEKCGKGYTEILANKITLDDVVNALSISDEVKTKTKEEKIQTIVNKIEKGNSVMFIDDFHLADEDVRTIVRQTRGSVALSTKNKISIARNEVFLSGIDESERDKLLDLIARRLDKHITNSARGKIKDIAEGHPASTEILVRNCDKINFDNVKGYKHGLDFSNTKHVEEFLKRVIREILSDNEFQLLMNLSVINSDLESDLNRETIQQTCQDADFDTTFAKLIDTCMLEKKPEYEGVYRFHYKHIQDAIKDNSKARHAWAIKYYENKVRKFGNNDDAVESLFHKLNLSQDSKLIYEFLTLSTKLRPVHYGFKRLIDIGEQIIKYSFINRVKVPVVVMLGNLYSAFNRFDDAENAYREALNIYKKLAEKNPDAYLPDLAMTQNNIGNSYSALKRFDDAEKAYREALKIRKELAEKNPDAYLPDLAMTQNNIGNLYRALERFDDAKKTYRDALNIYRKLAEKNPDTYLPGLAMTQNNIGNLYSNLKRFDDAEKAYLESLDIRKKLAEKNPDAYLPDLAMTQNNIGNLYRALERFDDAKKTYRDALNIYRKLAEKNPDTYLPGLAMTQNNIGNLYSNLKRFDDAEKAYLESLDIRKKLAEKNPDAYLPDLAMTQNNLKSLYLKLERFDDAEKIFKEI